jgi:hypothetical protein
MISHDLETIAATLVDDAMGTPAADETVLACRTRHLSAADHI